MEVFEISYREDYYKFAHYFFPYTVFKNPKTLIKNIVKYKDIFAENLTMLWSEIPLEKSKNRNESPIFGIEIKNINTGISLIVIEIPSAKEELEACYMGVAYDENYNVRYFTYEIAKGFKNNIEYALCEWTLDWNHIHYGFYSDKSIDTFTSNIKAIYNNEGEIYATNNSSSVN